MTKNRLTPSFDAVKHVAEIVRASSALEINTERDEMDGDPKGNYAEVNGLHMYYEIHGTGQPLVLLHGVVGAIEMFGEVMPPRSQKAGGSSPSICRLTDARPTPTAP